MCSTAMFVKQLSNLRTIFSSFLGGSPKPGYSDGALVVISRGSSLLSMGSSTKADAHLNYSTHTALVQPTVHSVAYPGMSHRCYFLHSFPLSLSLQLQRTNTDRKKRTIRY